MYTYILWNPDGIIVDLGFFALRWYSLLFALGFIAGYQVLQHYFKKEGIKQEKLDRLNIYLIIATVVGARLGHCLFYDFEYYSQHITKIFLPVQFSPIFQFTGFQGLASHGGGIALIIALVMYARRERVSLFWVLDVVAIATALVGAFIRLGNLMNSEIIGKPSSVAWAFVFSKIDSLPRHPAQLYEAILYLIIFAILSAISQYKPKPQGYIFGLFLTFVFSARFIVEFFKENQSAFEADMFLNMGQWLSTPFIIIGLVLLYAKHKQNTTHTGEVAPS